MLDMNADITKALNSKVPYMGVALLLFGNVSLTVASIVYVYQTGSTFALISSFVGVIAAAFTFRVLSDRWDRRKNLEKIAQAVLSQLAAAVNSYNDSPAGQTFVFELLKSSDFAQDQVWLRPVVSNFLCSKRMTNFLVGDYQAVISFVILPK